MVLPEVQSPNVIAVAASGGHSLCVTSDGKLWAMGYNFDGQLGITTDVGFPSRVQVATGLAGFPSPLTINTITFDAQGGSSISSATQIAALNYLYGTLPTPTRSGYTFGGWWTGPNGTGTQITATTTVTSAVSQTLYAKWTAVTLGTTQLDVNKFTLSLALFATVTDIFDVPDTFDITSNIAWTVQIIPTTATWLAVYSTAGTGNATITVTTNSANTTGMPRTASIVVNGGGITRTLIATQASTDTSTFDLAPAAPLPVGATFTLTVTDTTAPGNPQTTRAYTIVTGTTLTTTDASGALTLPYEYDATGDTGTLIIPDLDSVYSLQFTNATSGTLTLYTFDDDGPYELPGTFAYAPPAAGTNALIVTNGSGSGAYAANATVTITANAAPTGKVFDHWTSSNGGTFANANNATTTFTMPANAVTVTAIYSTPTPPNPPSPGGGGGGGAPSILYLAATLALAALRGASKRK